MKRRLTVGFAPIFALGDPAMTGYVSIRLMRLPADVPIEALLRRR